MTEQSIKPAVLNKLLKAGTRLWNEFQILAGDRYHLFVPCDQRDAYEELRKLSSRATSFLEFGSAAGVVTIMADLLGMEAYGIEIEAELAAAKAAAADAVLSDSSVEDLGPNYKSDEPFDVGAQTLENFQEESKVFHRGDAVVLREVWTLT